MRKSARVPRYTGVPEGRGAPRSCTAGSVLSSHAVSVTRPPAYRGTRSRQSPLFPRCTGGFDESGARFPRYAGGLWRLCAGVPGDKALRHFVSPGSPPVYRGTRRPKTLPPSTENRGSETPAPRPRRGPGRTRFPFRTGVRRPGRTGVESALAAIRGVPEIPVLVGAAVGRRVGESPGTPGNPSIPIRPVARYTGGRVTRRPRSAFRDPRHTGGEPAAP